MPDWSDRFVNPYTFVPFPEDVIRDVPPGHDAKGAAPVFSGTITVTWTLHTPLLLPRSKTATSAEAKSGAKPAAKDAGKEAKAVDIDPWYRPDGTLTIPGSAIKGALRSVHEAMFAGCARILDDQFLPSYRQAARSQTGQGWTLARVTKVSPDGKPVEVQLCDEVTWVEATALRLAYARAPGSSQDLPASGDTFDIDGPREELTYGNQGAAARLEMRAVSGVEDVQRSAHPDDPTDKWLLLVTDTAVRLQRSKAGARCFWAIGRITGARSAVDDAVATQFAYACAGSRDMQEISRDAKPLDQAPLMEVKWPRNTPAGWRRPATGFTKAGDALWVRRQDGRIAALAMAQIWRSVGQGPVAERIPPAVLPCAHPKGAGLCLSCEVFGSVDATGRKPGKSEQDAYRGHVRIGPARGSVEPNQIKPVPLAPLGAPRRGAGIFYLTDADANVSLPTQWDADDRTVRGRKFYWHHDADAQLKFWQQQYRGLPGTPRYKARAHQQQTKTGDGKKQTADAQLVLPRTTLTQQITVDQITEVGLRSLLAALVPSRVFGAGRSGRREYVHHLGGGKPFGLGAATAQIELSDIRVVSLAARYSGSEELPDWSVSPNDGTGYRDRCGQLKPLWGPLARVMAEDGLVEGGQDWRNYVSYPPAARWNEYGSRRFDESYTFFKDNDGQRFTRVDDHGWQPLPTLPADPDEGSDPTLKIGRFGRYPKR